MACTPCEERRKKRQAQQKKLLAERKAKMEQLKAARRKELEAEWLTEEEIEQEVSRIWMVFNKPEGEYNSKLNVLKSEKKFYVK